MRRPAVHESGSGKSSAQPDGGEGLAKCKGYRREAVSEGSIEQTRESMDKNRIQGASIGRAGNVPRSPYPSKMRSVDSATVRGRRLSLPQERSTHGRDDAIDPSETSTAHCGRASDDGLPTLLWNRGFRCFTSSNFMLSSAVWLHTDQTYPHMRPMPPSSPYDPRPAARRRPCRRRSGSCQRIHQVDAVAGIAVSRPFVPARACASWLSSSTSAFS